MLLEDKLKDFLENFHYFVLHEEANNNKNVEYFFTIIDKSDVKDKKLDDYLKLYTKKYPVKDLSPQSMSFFEDNPDNYYLFIDSLDKKDVFYKQKEKFVINNASNILSIKWTGKPIDMGSHILYNTEKYVEDFKIISNYLGHAAKEKIKTNITKGKEIFSEKRPMLEEKLRSIFKKK